MQVYKNNHKMFESYDQENMTKGVYKSVLVKKAIVGCQNIQRTKKYLTIVRSVKKSFKQTLEKEMTGNNMVMVHWMPADKPDMWWTLHTQREPVQGGLKLTCKPKNKK